MRVPWTARRLNQSILKESTLNIHWKDWAEAEAPILWPPDVKSQLFEKDPDAEKIEGRRRGQQKMRWLDGLITSMDMGLSKLWKTVKDREAGRAAVHGAAKSWTQAHD